jgi:hypothetical protein
MRHRIVGFVLYVAMASFSNACSGNGGASADGSGAFSNGNYCDTSTPPLPADCSGRYECLGSVARFKGQLVRTATSCTWQAATALNPAFDIELSDPDVEIDGRIFFTHGKIGDMTCWPADDEPTTP